MTQQEFNEMLSVALAQQIAGGTYIHKYDGEEIDAGVARALPGGEIDNLRPGQNLLDNAYFIDPINQRGQTEYSSAGYTIDRWKINPGETVEITANGLKLSRSSAAKYSLSMNQVIEADRIPIGAQCTFSMLLTENTMIYPTGLRAGGNTIGSIPAGITGLISGTFTYSEEIRNNPLFGCQLALSDVGHVTVAAAKLELGSQQTLAHQDVNGNWVLNDPPPNKATELAKCQRYQPIVINTGANEFASIGTGPVVTSTASGDMIKIQIPLPVTPRGRPTLVYANINNFQLRGSNYLHPTAMSIDIWGPNSVTINCNAIEGEIIPGEVYELIALPGASLILDFNL